MKLVIDIGNSRIKAALFLGSEMQEKKVFTSSLAEESMSDLLAGKKIAHCLLSCVSGDPSPLTRYLENKNIVPRQLHSSMDLPFTLRYRSPHTLGSDRLAAVAGANTIFPNSSVLIIDAGTAITYDYLTEKGVYMGGNISPGLHSRLRCLHENTGSLPLCLPDKEILGIGYDTPSAIIAGVQQSVIFEINEYIRQFQKKPAEQKVIITGGDAGFLKEFLSKRIEFEPDLVIKGLNSIIEYNE